MVSVMVVRNFQIRNRKRNRERRNSSSSSSNMKDIRILEKGGGFLDLGLGRVIEMFDRFNGLTNNSQGVEGENENSNQYEAPVGPPPKWKRKQEEEIGYEYAPPPPAAAAATRSHHSTTAEQSSSTLPPYHDWQSIEDTALLPPPPSVRHEHSANNSSEEDAVRAHDWVQTHPLFTPSKPHSRIYAAVQEGDVNLVKPREMRGDVVKMGIGSFQGKAKSSRDALLVTSLPLYFASEDHPSANQGNKIIYFEVETVSIGAKKPGRGGREEEDSGLCLGFCAQPYPTWRLVGHERASLGVHGDDGRRFINDSYGGIDFTGPFQEGDILGIGMRFRSTTTTDDDDDFSSPIPIPISTAATTTTADIVEVFFTRNGRVEGTWNLFEQRDQASGDVKGLEGRWDLYGAIGVFGDVEFKTEFSRHRWTYHPS